MNGETLLTILSATLVLSYDANGPSPQDLISVSGGQTSARMGLNCNSCACIEPTEYCELEQFRPRCPDDKVIIITEARYGLVSLGRCLQADFGYVGCFADVVDYVSAKCSGRRACEQQVPDRYMKEAAARCRQEFNGFLYAAYKCIDAGDRRCTNCRSEGVMRLNADSGGGFMGSVVVDDHHDDNGCGTSRCPWVISGQPGQVINLTVYEYHSELRRPQTSSDSSRSPSLSNGVVARRPSSSRSSSSSAASCTGSARRLAVVKERSNPVDSSICATVNPTDHVTTRHVFTSVSYVIELRVIARKTRDTAFLLHYQAVGCADMSPPANTVLRRIDDKSEVRCLLSGVTWVFQCVEGRWEGNMGVCEQPSFNVQSLGGSLVDHIGAFYNMSYNYIATLHPGIIVTSLISVFVIVVVVITTCCFVCSRRRQYKRQYRRPSQHQTFQRPLVAGKTAAVTPKLLPAGAPAVDVYADDLNDYTRGGGGCAVHRPLPSLPRRMEDSWAKSVRSDASGSDASLHWDTPDDDGTAGFDVDDPQLPPVHSRRVRCRSIAAGAGDFSLAAPNDAAAGSPQTVRNVPPAYRTMPRPSVVYGTMVGDGVNEQQLMDAQLMRQQQHRPSDFRPYANISDHSVDV